MLCFFFFFFIMSNLGVTFEYAEQMLTIANE